MINTYEVVARDEDSARGADISEEVKRGRPKSTRIPYLAEAEKPHKRRVERVSEHETIIRFIGQWFPRNNSPTGHNELHAACILLFLKTWRQLSDLKEKNETFTQCLTRFLDTATDEQKDFVENIQYYHDCWDVAQKRRDAFRQGKTFRIFDYEQESLLSEEGEAESGMITEEINHGATQEHNDRPIDEHAIERARLKQRDRRDRVFAEEAMRLAFAANAFGDVYKIHIHPQRVLQRRANNDDMVIIANWAALLKDMTRKQITEDGLENIRRLHAYAQENDIRPSIRLDNGELKPDARNGQQGFNNVEEASETGGRSTLTMLNDEQRNAHNIVERRLFGGERLLPTIYEDRMLMSLQRTLHLDNY